MPSGPRISLLSAPRTFITITGAAELFVVFLGADFPPAVDEGGGGGAAA